MTGISILAATLWWSFLWLCREFANEYRIERGMRRKLESDGAVCDFVIAGGIYDDNRVARAMHGAYPETKKDVVLRSAGNRVFPNGTVAVELKAPRTAKIVVELDSDGASDCTMRKAWGNGVWKVVIGKKGTEYPGVLSVSARCNDAAESRVTVESRPSPDARFEFVEVRPVVGCAGGALDECLLPEIRPDGISESAVRFGSDGLKSLDAVSPSCGYLVVAEPRTRKGVVLGWTRMSMAAGLFLSDGSRMGLLSSPRLSIMGRCPPGHRSPHRTFSSSGVSTTADWVSTSLHIASPVYGVKKGSALTIPGEPLEVRTYSRDRGLQRGRSLRDQAGGCRLLNRFSGRIGNV